MESQTKIQEAVNKIRSWREDPDTFVMDNFGAIPDKWQSRALKAFVDEDPEKARICLSACAGVGKSAAISWCALLFLGCYCGKGEHPVGAVVSETHEMLQDTLWKELAKWMAMSPYLSSQFTWTKTRVYSNQFPKTWYLTARSYSKTANEEERGRTLSGLHSDYIAYFIDESGDMSTTVLKSAEQGLTNCKFGKIITAGNPTSHQGLLYFAAEEDADNWHVIRITGDPDDPERSSRVSKKHAQKMIDLYGREDPWVMAYILGRFPKSAINTLMSPDEVRDSIARGKASSLTAVLYEKSQKRLGIDVALYGDDKTVIFPRQGLRAFPPVCMRNTAADGEAPSRIAARVMEAKNRWGSEMEFVDCTGGYGDGVINYLRDAGATPTRVNYASKASDDDKYANKRTEMYFKMRDWVRSGGILPNDSELIKELSSPTYTLKNGKLALEPKERIKERIKRSPDKADALAQTFYMADMPAGSVGKPEIEMLAYEGESQDSNWEPNWE